MDGDDAALGLLDNRYHDRADMGGGSDCNKRWGSGMSEWREELIEKMAFVMFEYAEEQSRLRFRDVAHAALAVAEPVIREQCAEDAAAIAKEHLTDAVARIVAAAIREGGND